MTRKLTEREFKALEEIAGWPPKEYPYLAYSKKRTSMKKLEILGFVKPDSVYPKTCFRITDAGRKFIEGFPPKDWNTADQ